ncbi:TRAP transporter substrate-binding protein DctP [candidate division KSB3 bacterium]|uniref:TRAP transporter substrate-binding protein DctP n=1 Tax=candidate division KSB3 bacterium TaxID=2044937 RepID=A0A2G6E507_9BACT|nr:MAG: TRAP transporter substrate-binding protein DctP [candidate division KSB3 bacterium]PIE29819.1 MAG: TRAP transporter substrate-binding protein DctP [candidate division KSB3 bacterium]
MKNILLSILGCLMIIGSSGWAAAEEQIVIRWSDVLSPPNPHPLMMEKVAEIVAEKSNGRIEIQVYPGGQLGSSRDTIESLSLGMHEMATEGVSHLESWYPAVNAIQTMPYIYKDPAHVQRVLESPIGREILETIREKSGIRVLGAAYYGKRNVTTSSKEINAVDDMAGFKLRVPESAVYIAFAKAWGAKPTPISFGELYLALKQSVVDGQENPLPTIWSAKFYEVQKYLVLTGHILDWRAVLINEEFFQSLSPEDQTLLADAVKEGIAWCNETILQQEAELVEKLQAEGMTVIEPDVDSFRSAVLEKVPAEFKDKWGDLIEKIVAID